MFGSFIQGSMPSRLFLVLMKNRKQNPKSSMIKTIRQYREIRSVVKKHDFKRFLHVHYHHWTYKMAEKKSRKKDDPSYKDTKYQRLH